MPKVSEKKRKRGERLPKPVSGDRFFSWTVVEYLGSHCLCKCDCGNEVLVPSGNLMHNRSKMCRPCATRKKNFEGRRLRHLPDKIYQRLFWAVDNAIKRCTDSSHKQWKDYGGRGIKVCDEWMDDKWKFIEHLSTLEGHDNPSLVVDREDNDGNYEPGNLRFVTHSESCFNRRPFIIH